MIEEPANELAHVGIIDPNAARVGDTYPGRRRRARRSTHSAEELLHRNCYCRESARESSRWLRGWLPATFAARISRCIIWWRTRPGRLGDGWARCATLPPASFTRLDFSSAVSRQLAVEPTTAFLHQRLLTAPARCNPLATAKRDSRARHRYCTQSCQGRGGPPAGAD